MYLRTHGATVDVTDDPERATYRTELGIDDEVASCHTAEVDGYVIEGHVPAEAIEQLLIERPDAVGLALPGMPADSPGMGGDTDDWANQPVVLVHTDGSLSDWSWYRGPLTAAIQRDDATTVIVRQKVIVWSAQSVQSVTSSRLDRWVSAMSIASVIPRASMQVPQSPISAPWRAAVVSMRSRW